MKALTSHAEISLLRQRTLALFCSRNCPGSIIVQTLDVVRALRETSRTVVSGFQSPTEQECLEILLRGERPVIVCPARSAEGMRIPAAWKPAIAAGRMLITSPFEKTVRRATAALAEERNRFVVSLADAVFIPHAAPGGSLDRLCCEIVVQASSLQKEFVSSNQGRLEACTTTAKPLLTLDDPANTHLLPLSARPIRVDDLPNPFYC